MHKRHSLLFAGDDGVTSNGLVAISTDLLVSIINSHGARLRLIVLNGCTTLDAARAILLQCPTVEHCICWTTSVDSEVASIFATAIAHTLAAEGYVAGSDGHAMVCQLPETARGR